MLEENNGRKVYKKGSGSCPMAGFDISNVEYPSSVMEYQLVN
jgi:hypothetical protein